MSEPCLTPAEWERVRAYDEQTRKEMEAAEHPPTPPDAMKELREALEKSSLDCLRELQEDIAVLLRVREHWPNNQEIQDMTTHLITLHRGEIDTIREEIQNARS